MHSHSVSGAAVVNHTEAIITKLKFVSKTEIEKE